MPEPERTSVGPTVSQDAYRVGSRCALAALVVVLLAGLSTSAGHLPVMLGMAGLLATGAGVFGALITLTMHADDLENDVLDPKLLAAEMRTP